MDGTTVLLPSTKSLRESEETGSLWQTVSTPRKIDSFAQTTEQNSLGNGVDDQDRTSDLSVWYEPPTLLEQPHGFSDSTPIQIWEGRVLQIDSDNGIINSMLTPKMGIEDRHTADISFQWVTEQDMDLVKLGAIFYLTLYKRTKRGSIVNSQELRFRRRPSWSASQLKKIDEAVIALQSKKWNLSIKND